MVLAPDYSLYIAGKQILEFQSLDFESTLDLNVNSATIQFPDFDSLSASNPLGADVQIKRDNTLIWRGLGTGYQKMYDSTGSKQYNLLCKDTKIYLGRELFQKGGNYYQVYGSSQMISDTVLNNCQSSSGWSDNPGGHFTSNSSSPSTTNNMNTTQTPGTYCIDTGLPDPAPTNTQYCIGYDLGSSGTDFTNGSNSQRIHMSLAGTSGLFVGIVLIDTSGNYRLYQFPLSMCTGNSTAVNPGWYEIFEVDISSYTTQVGTFDPTHIRYVCAWCKTPNSTSGSYALFVNDIRLRSYSIASSATTVFADILACQNNPTLVGGQQPSNTQYVLTTFNNFFALQALQQMIQLTCLETRFNPDLTVDLLPQVGSDLSYSILFETSLNMRKTEWDYAIDGMINNVIVAGSSTNLSQVSVKASNTSSISQYGRWSKIFNFPNVYDETLLQSYANAVLVDMIVPTDTYSATVWDNHAGVAFQVGDTVSLKDDVLGDNMGYRIFSIHRRYDSQNHEVVDCTFVRNFRQVDVLNWRVFSLQNILNNWSQGLTSVANNVTVGQPTTTPPNPTTGTINETFPSTVNQTEEVNCSFVVQNEAGQVSQIEIDITATGGDELSSLYVYDLTTNTAIISVSSYTSGTKETYTTTSDITGHEIYIIFRTYNVIGSGVTAAIAYSSTVTTQAAS